MSEPVTATQPREEERYRARELSTAAQGGLLQLSQIVLSTLNIDGTAGSVRLTLQEAQDEGGHFKACYYDQAGHCLACWEDPPGVCRPCSDSKPGPKSPAPPEFLTA